MIKRICMGFGFLVALSGCLPDVNQYQGVTTEAIRFKSTGGFTLTPMFEYIDLEQDADGRVVGSLKTQDCEAKGVVSPVDYAEIAFLIERSPRQIAPVNFIQDAGATTVTLEENGKSGEPMYLAEGSGSSGKILLLDGPAIAARIREAGAALREEHGCGPIKNLLSVARYYRQSEPAHSPNDYSSMPAYPGEREANTIDLSVHFNSVDGTPRISGSIRAQKYHQPVAGKPFQPLTPECMTTFKDTKMNAPDLRAAAQSLEIYDTQVICAVALIFDPYWRTVQPSLSLTDQAGRTDTGYFSCEYNKRVRGHEKFMALLDDWLRSNDRCASNPLLMRP